MTLKFIKSSTINTKRDMVDDIQTLIEDFNGDNSQESIEVMEVMLDEEA